MRLRDEWLLTPDRFVFYLPTKTAVLADMHLGYVAARRGDGEAVPHFGETERLEDLARHLGQLRTRDVVVAGDLVEASHYGQAVVEQWAEQLAAHDISLHLVPGNHDQGLPVMKCLRVHAEGYRLGVWTVLHDAAVDDSRALLFGHLHPCLRSALAPGEAACYLVGPNRILLPAWCDHAAGVSIFSLGDWPDTDCFAIASEQVVALGQVTTLRGKLSRRYKPFKIGSGLGT